MVLSSGQGQIGFHEDFNYLTTIKGTCCEVMVGPYFTYKDDCCGSAALQAAEGGVVRLTTHAGCGKRSILVGGLNYRAESGPIIFEVRATLQCDVCAKAVFIGLTDSTCVENPIESACGSDSITTTATDAVGFMYDTIGSTDRWKLVGVDSDTDAPSQIVSVAECGTPVACTYQVFRIEVYPTGSCNKAEAIFSICGKKVGTTMSDAVSANVSLAPIVAIEARECAANKVDVDTMDITGFRNP